MYKRTHDVSVLATLYSRYMELVYAVCFRYLDDAENSKDAVMEIYGELVGKLLKHEVANFRSWLYSVARNHCLMKLRSKKTAGIINIDDVSVQSAETLHQDHVVKEEQLVIMEECVERLPVEQKQVIVLFYLQQHCYNQIVQLTGFEWNKVRSLVQNGRRNLRICMEKKQHTDTQQMK